MLMNELPHLSNIIHSISTKTKRRNIKKRSRFIKIIHDECIGMVRKRQNMAKQIINAFEKLKFKQEKSNN